MLSVMEPAINLLKRSVKSAIPKRLHPLEAYKRALKARAGGAVLGGPFRGMRQALPMCDETGPGEDLLVVLGVYEREIHGVVEEACSLRPRLVVNVGGYRGYYGVGLGLRLNEAAVVVYETNATNHRYIRLNAEQNGLTNVEVRGSCGIDELRECIERHVPDSSSRAARGDVLIVCDIDGGERTLMDPVAVPRLRTAAILLEVHGPDMRELMTSRFSASHDLRYFPIQPHTSEEFLYRPWYTTFSDLAFLLAEREIADDYGWFWMKPNGTAGE
jgi:hypothetical protein